MRLTGNWLKFSVLERLVFVAADVQRNKSVGLFYKSHGGSAAA
jgi:hypothetical protein